MLRGLFVTGTDTGAGKTVASAALMLHVRQFAQVRYWKPIQTGIEEDDDTATVRELAACSDDVLLIPVQSSSFFPSYVGATALPRCWPVWSLPTAAARWSTISTISSACAVRWASIGRSE